MLTEIREVKNYLQRLQGRLCTLLEEEDGERKFLLDEWQYTTGGGGLTRILTNGPVIEKAGVNFSHVLGDALPRAATEKRPDLVNAAFQALGISVVVHPVNPFVPTTHMNLRFIIVQKPDQQFKWWFGGGFDLTPYYGFDEDCIHWHKTAKKACDPFGVSVYQQYKNECDKYFYLKHRNEPRGIGGIFFDDLHEWGFEHCFAFMQSVGSAFIAAYQPIIAKRKHHAFTQAQKEFQTYRRGRYVEFNLLYDRGTLFGIQSGGRTESIFMSLPPVVNWSYNWHPKNNSLEEKLYNYYLTPHDWANK